MSTLITAIKGKETYPYTLEEDERILSVLEKAEKSSENEKHEKVSA
jgi:hypothetical protein